jgi:hypothetical protein
MIIRDGVLWGVYDDRLLPIYAALGCFEVSRASTVEFDSAARVWIARDVATGRELGRAPDRREAIDQEIAELERGL